MIIINDSIISQVRVTVLVVDDSVAEDMESSPAAIQPTPVAVPPGHPLARSAVIKEFLPLAQHVLETPFRQ